MKYFYIVNVLKKKDFENKPTTIHGTLTHGALELLFSGTEEEEVIRIFRRKWGIFCKIYRNFIDHDKYDTESMLESSCEIIKNIKRALREEFGSYDVLYVEKKLEINLEPWGHDQIFVGFIDIVIKQRETGKIIIIDFKNTETKFMFNSFKDKYKDYQLSLYKFFLCMELKEDVKNVETYFCLLERAKKSKKRISLEKIGSSKVKLKNSYLWMNKSLKAINKSIYYTNRQHCNSYGKKCTFWKTDLCPK